MYVHAYVVQLIQVDRLGWSTIFVSRLSVGMVVRTVTVVTAADNNHCAFQSASPPAICPLLPSLPPLVLTRPLRLPTATTIILLLLPLLLLRQRAMTSNSRAHGSP